MFKIILKLNFHKDIKHMMLINPRWHVQFCHLIHVMNLNQIQTNETFCISYSRGHGLAESGPNWVRINIGLVHQIV